MTLPRTVVYLVLAVSTVSTDKWVFPGANRWYKDEVDLCEAENTPEFDEEYDCSSYIWFYEKINVEVLKSDPPVIAYRRFVPDSYIRDYLNEIKLVKAPGPRENVFATEFAFRHQERPGVERLFKRLRRYIPYLNFLSSDPWQVLVFKEKEHYPRRHDYIKHDSDAAKDSLLKKFGNRFASFMVTLQNAKDGGAKIFPTLGTTFRMEPGDGLLYVTMETDREKAFQMVHADCPVFKGEKITATLRLRERGQYVLARSRRGGFYDYSSLVAPSLSVLRKPRKS